MAVTPEKECGVPLDDSALVWSYIDAVGGDGDMNKDNSFSALYDNKMNDRSNTNNYMDSMSIHEVAYSVDCNKKEENIVGGIQLDRRNKPRHMGCNLH